jgi:O-methyltransferase domain/Dimerisation domain
MPENDRDAAETMPPHVQLVEMATAHFVSQIVYAAAKLGLADDLATKPKSAEELAKKTGTHAPSLYRLMRALANLGILSEDAARCFALTSLGEALKTSAPRSARAAVLTFASDWWIRGFGQLLYSVETGRSGFEKSLGMPLFDWLQEHPEEASMFSESMACVHGAEDAAVANAYDFSGLTTIVDVGGATGNLLATILGKYPRSRGILFDLPHVVRGAPPLMRALGMADRVTIEGGNFFEKVPSGADAYLLSHIIHDWAEDQCVSILRNCRDAMNHGSRLLIIETVLPPGHAPHVGKIFDIVMLVAPGGQERTQQEYNTLLRKVGLCLTRVVPTESLVSVVEAVLPQEDIDVTGH